MKFFEQQDGQDIGEALIEGIVKDTGKDIFAMATLESNEQDLKMIITFTDKSILLAELTLETHENKPVARVKGNYLP